MGVCITELHVLLRKDYDEISFEVYVETEAGCYQTLNVLFLRIRVIVIKFTLTCVMYL